MLLKLIHDKLIRDMAMESQQLRIPTWLKSESANTRLSENVRPLTSFIQSLPPGWIEENKNSVPSLSLEKQS